MKQKTDIFMEVSPEYRDKVTRIVKYFHLNPDDLYCYTNRVNNDVTAIFVRSFKRDRFLFTWHPIKRQISVWRYPDRGTIVINDDLALRRDPELPRRDILEELRKSSIK